jgi:hypothetical protein
LSKFPHHRVFKAGAGSWFPLGDVSFDGIVIRHTACVGSQVPLFNHTPSLLLRVTVQSLI